MSRFEQQTSIVNEVKAYASTLVRWIKLRLPSTKINTTCKNDRKVYCDLPPASLSAVHSTAIVRLDDIGDYIIFRQSLKDIRKHPKLKNTKLWLIGNQLWKNLAEEWDAHVFDHFYWIDKSKFISDTNYRANTFLDLRRLGVSTAICPSFTRNPILEDALVQALAAPKNIAWLAPLSVLTLGSLNKSMSLYQIAIVPTPGPVHERNRGLEFWVSLFEHRDWKTEKTISLEFTKPPNFEPAATKKSEKTPLQIVLVPGSGIKSKCWAPQNFAELAKMIANASSLAPEFILVGGPGDLSIAEQIILHEPHLTWKNLVGKTSLTDLSAVISNANLVVAGDTGAANLAAYLGTPLLVLSTGTAWARFFPFERENLVCLSTPTFQKILKNNGLNACYAWRGSTNINEISPKMAFAELMQNGMLNHYQPKR